MNFSFFFYLVPYKKITSKVALIVSKPSSDFLPEKFLKYISVAVGGCARCYGRFQFFGRIPCFPKTVVEEVFCLPGEQREELVRNHHSQNHTACKEQNIRFSCENRSHNRSGAETSDSPSNPKQDCSSKKGKINVFSFRDRKLQSKKRGASFMDQSEKNEIGDHRSSHHKGQTGVPRTGYVEKANDFSRFSHP